MKKQIIYTIVGVFAFFSVVQAEEALDASKKQEIRENARAAVLTMKNSKEFNEARTARKAYSDAVDAIPEVAQLNQQVPATEAQAAAHKQQRDKAIKDNEKSLQKLKKDMDSANAALDRKMRERSLVAK